jgi:GGDEF domain-containing protein
MTWPWSRRGGGSVPAAKAWAALLVAWGGVSLAAAVYLDPEPTRVLPPALLAAVSTVGLWRPWRHAGLLLAVPALALYVYLVLLTSRAASGGLAVVAPSIAIVALGLLGSGALAEGLAAQTESDELQREHDARMIEELTPTLGGTEAMKWEHADPVIREELARARRYDYKVSLGLIGIHEWDLYVDQHGPAAGDALQLEVARVLQGCIRTTDRLAFLGPGKVAFLLPHTPAGGARIVLDRLRLAAQETPGIDLRAGLVEFPEDGVDADTLVQEAASALVFAEQSGLGVASRSLLQ